MRNLAEYPITYQEKLDFLKEMKEHFKDRDKHILGCIKGSVINAIEEDVKNIEHGKQAYINIGV